MEKNNTIRSSGSVLIKNGKIVSANSPFNNKIINILINKGKIVSIGNQKEKADHEIDASNCIVTTGLLDLRCRQGEPGNEQNENLESLSKAASAGGFTGVSTLPDFSYIVQSAAQIEYQIKKTSKNLVNVYPQGALTLNCEGKELAEIYEMYSSGAVGFSNGDNPVNYGTLQRAMLYIKNFDGIIFSHAQDQSLSKNGEVNESENTVALGLKIFPEIAEYTQISSQIEIAKYTDSKIHFSHISSAKSVELIKKAKKENVKVTCDVSILHLIYTDDSLNTFDSNLKIMPPLRSEKDRLALLKGINDGTIDCIVSDHYPHCPENKIVEFSYSPFGAITIQILFSLYNEFLSDKISFDTFVKVTSENPRNILKIKMPEITENSEANIAVFDISKNWEFNKKSNFSLSSNSHLINKTLKGKCIFAANNNNYTQF